MNGSEDARDHLWLAQDLWMQDAPWNWVSRDPFVQAQVLRECSNVQCKKREERVGQWQKCAGCKQVSGLVDIVLCGVVPTTYTAMVLLSRLSKVALAGPQEGVQRDTASRTEHANVVVRVFGP
jgi:hypothetical protein